MSRLRDRTVRAWVLAFRGERPGTLRQWRRAVRRRLKGMSHRERGKTLSGMRAQLPRP